MLNLIRTREVSLIGESTERNMILNSMKFMQSYGRIIISEVVKENELAVLLNDKELGIPKEREQTDYSKSKKLFYSQCTKRKGNKVRRVLATIGI